MNVLRKKRKNNRKIRLKRIILLIFSLMMTTLAWFTYSKLLSSNVKIHINSWDISFFVDENKNDIAEPEEERENPLDIDLSDLYPGMQEQTVKVIIKNNGETDVDIFYTFSKIEILGNTYEIVETAPETGEYYILANQPIEENGISTMDFINEPLRFPFKIVVEHKQEIPSLEQGYMLVKVTWPSYEEDDTEEEKNRKDELDTKWGYQFAKYIEDNKDNPDFNGAFHLELNINAIGAPRNEHPSKIAGQIATLEDKQLYYGDYTNYPVDIDGDPTDNDWRIFYSDGKNVFLIADDYAKRNIDGSPVKEAVTKAGIINNTLSVTYGTSWHSFTTATTINEESKFFLGANEIGKASYEAKQNPNYKASSTLLNTEYWHSLVDINNIGTADDLAYSAIGTPTIEMFIKSWNEKYNENLIYKWDEVTNNGYKIGIENTLADQIDLSSKYNKYEDASLYFNKPDTSIMDDLSEINGYRICSPSAKDINNLLYVASNGKIASNEYTYVYYAIRPVVMLKYSTEGLRNAEGVWELSLPKQTLALVKNDNIGDYIDLGNDIVDYNGTTGVTTDDWRILNIDEENGTVCAILSSFLPNSTGHSTRAGLQTLKEYRVYSNGTVNDFVNRLIGTENAPIWKELANGILGAKVEGTPKLELITESLTRKNGNTLISSDMENASLYVPYEEEINFTEGYWLANIANATLNKATRIDNTYNVEQFDITDTDFGIRPVVYLPIETSVIYENGLWTIQK